MDTEQTTNSGDRNIDNRPETKRNVVTRYQQTNQMETCTVCGGSFRKGKGLKIHMTKSGCRALEINRNKNKSKKGSPQDKHHSGSARETIPGSSASPNKTSKKEENVTKDIRSPAVDSTRKPDSGDNILQCKDKQVNAPRQHNPKLFRQSKIVQQALDSVLKVDEERLMKRTRRSVCVTEEELIKPRRQSKSKKKENNIQSMDIRTFAVKTDPLLVKRPSTSGGSMGYKELSDHDVPRSSPPSSPQVSPKRVVQSCADQGAEQELINIPEECTRKNVGSCSGQGREETKTSYQEESPSRVLNDTHTEEQPIDNLEEEGSPKKR